MKLDSTVTVLSLPVWSVIPGTPVPRVVSHHVQLTDCVHLDITVSMVRTSLHVRLVHTVITQEPHHKMRDVNRVLLAITVLTTLYPLCTIQQALSSVLRCVSSKFIHYYVFSVS